MTLPVRRPYARSVRPSWLTCAPLLLDSLDWLSQMVCAPACTHTHAAAWRTALSLCTPAPHVARTPSHRETLLTPACSSPCPPVVINGSTVYAGVQCTLYPRASSSAASVLASLSGLTALAAPASQLLDIVISAISPAERVALVVHRSPSAPPPPASPDAALSVGGADAAAAALTTADGIAPGALGALLVTLAVIGIGGFCLCCWLRVQWRRPKGTASQQWPIGHEGHFTSCGLQSVDASIELQQSVSATPYQGSQGACAVASTSPRRSTPAGASHIVIAQQVEALAPIRMLLRSFLCRAAPESRQRAPGFVRPVLPATQVSASTANVGTVADVPTIVHQPFGDPFPTVAPSDAMPLSEDAAGGSSGKRWLSRGVSDDEKTTDHVSAPSMAAFHLEKGQAIATKADAAGTSFMSGVAASCGGDQGASSSGSTEYEEMLAPISYQDVSVSRI